MGTLFALLVIPGLIGFELWPLTGWRMYSRAASDTRLDWGVTARTANGDVELGWTDLPLAYRLAAWPLAEADRGSTRRRDETCHALLEGVRRAVPQASGVKLVRIHRRLVPDPHRVVEEREEFFSCSDE